jgi:AraC-like DNA-binding protein
MKPRPEVQFLDNLPNLKRDYLEKDRHLNDVLGKVSASFKEMVFEGMVVKIELCHLRQADSDSKVGWHIHPFTELTWVEGGDVVYEYEKGKVRVRDGEFFFMPAFTSHRWSTDKRPSRLHGFMLSILPRVNHPDSLLPRLSLVAEKLKFRLPKNKEASDSIRKGEEAASLDDALGYEAAGGHLRVGLSSLFRKIVDLLPKASSLDLPTMEKERPVALERAVAFINSNLSEGLSAGDVAKEVRFSPRHLDRIFNATFECPVGTFIQRTRLERARHLLGNPSLSIKQVSYACGYSDPNYFGRQFRQRYGKSPGVFRQGTP